MADIFRARGEAYRRSHALTSEQVKAMLAIEQCRTSSLGGHVDVCESCDFRAVSYNSCRNRHCPKCQSLAQARWIEDRKARILPTPYYHVVLTLPSPLRSLARQVPSIIYDLLFHAASRSIQKLGLDPKYLGGQVGFTAVLHTWTRKLDLHPHLHCIVTAGGLAATADRWVPPRGADRFLFPVRVLSRLFRGIFLDRLTALFEADSLPFRPDDPTQRERFQSLTRCLFAQEWVTYAKRPFAGAEHVYQYLGRYTHRVGISNHRLRVIDADTVTFWTKDGKDLTLPHDEFIRRFLQHVLPHRFVKIRHYGLMASSNATTKLETARALLIAASGTVSPPPAGAKSATWDQLLLRLTGVDPLLCPRCGARLVRHDLRDFACRSTPRFLSTPQAPEP